MGSFFTVKGGQAETTAPLPEYRNLDDIAPKVDFVSGIAARPANPIQAQPASFAAAGVVTAVTTLLPSIKDLIGLIPNSGNKKKLCANMVRGVERAERSVAQRVAAGSSSLSKISDTLRSIAASGKAIEPGQLEMLALAIEMGLEADAKERAANAAAMIANCDALGASMDYLVGEDDK